MICQELFPAGSHDLSPELEMAESTTQNFMYSPSSHYRYVLEICKQTPPPFLAAHPKSVVTDKAIEEIQPAHVFVISFVNMWQ